MNKKSEKQKLLFSDDGFREPGGAQNPGGVGSTAHQRAVAAMETQVPAELCRP